MSQAKGRPHFDELYARARAVLAAGIYRPGDRVGVKDLADRLSASTTPAREILSRLVGQDLVEEHRSEGYYLRPLDERQIAALYHLHGLCVDQALRAVRATPLPIIDDEVDAWTLCDRVVEASGNVVLLDVRRFLDRRLALLRRCEARLFDDLAAEARQIAARLTDDNRAAQRLLIRAFHRRRSTRARQLAFCASRP